MSQSQDIDQKIKDSIQLPKTDFPMRGQLPTTEPKRIDDWTRLGIYKKMVKQNSSDKKFVMPDGPPYANGNLHVGHVLNKVLKDIVIKYKNMQGYRSAFIPGWDCHGLPIELQVAKKLGKHKKELSDKEFRDHCREYAMGWVNTQREQFQRLGVLADWDNPYLTLAPEYEAEEIRVLAKIHRNGLLYRGEKPVNWCPTLQTALAAAEVEYLDHTSPSVYVKFPLKQDLEKLGSPQLPVSFVIWTTTPWTLPANLGICVNEKFEYGLYEHNQELLIIAKDLKEAVEKNCEIQLKLTSTYTGDVFEHLQAQHPFIDRTSLVMLGDHVTLEAGTGCVHTAPGHGVDDYNVGLRYGLPAFSPVDPAGRYTDEFAEMKGTKIWDANKLLIEKMQSDGTLLGFKQITHSYPHNPRSKTPLIFRATPQWFVQMDGEETQLRKKALYAAEKEIQFVPKWGAQRLQAMIQNTPDWCLSRQRTWGVPIPVFYCEKCEEAICDADVMERVADKMESSGEGLEAYHNTNPKEFIGDKKCQNCGHDQFKPGQDILDVWFDSGVCHSSVQKKREELEFPADIYLEGSDQHRGWFQTSLMSSMAAYGKSPYKALITHGFVNDAQGYKMSKSRGNVVDPAKIIQAYGAEILRLWVAYEDYGQDVTVGDEMFKRISETYRRIRNTLRFILGNLNDFDPSKDAISFGDMPALDQWALIQLNGLVKKTTEAFDSFNFYKVYHNLNNFFTVDLSATYLDILKDRLYTGKVNGKARRSSQTVIFEMVDTLVRMMAPILTFISEETYEYLPKQKQESVLLEKFPQFNEAWKNDELERKMDVLIDIRARVSKVLEPLRSEKTIGSSLDAQVFIAFEGETYKILREFENQLREFFIVSSVELKNGPEKIEAQKAGGEKCSRCWHYAENLNTHADWPGICPKCVEAVT